MPERDRNVWSRLRGGLMTGMSPALGLALASHHPLFPVAAVLLFLLWSAVVAWRPGLWLFVLPAALPGLNFAPWTGWLVADEFDLLCLGAVCGSGVRQLWQGGMSRGAASSAAYRVFMLAASLFATVSTVACMRGLAHAGDVPFSLFQGYADMLNAWRVYKSVAWMALLWPSLWREVQTDPDGSARRLAWGMVAGLTVVTLAVLWERLAYTGLWDFSVRYRTTALLTWHWRRPSWPGRCGARAPRCAGRRWHCWRCWWGMPA